MTEPVSTYYHSPVGILKISGTDEYICEVSFHDKTQMQKGRKKNLPPMIIHCREKNGCGNLKPNILTEFKLCFRSYSFVPSNCKGSKCFASAITYTLPDFPLRIKRMGCFVFSSYCTIAWRHIPHGLMGSLLFFPLFLFT